MTEQGENIPGSSQMWFVRGRSIKMFPIARCHGTVKNTSFLYTVMCERRKRSSLCQLSEATVVAFYVITTKVPQSTGDMGRRTPFSAVKTGLARSALAAVFILLWHVELTPPWVLTQVDASSWVKGSRELEAEDSHIVQSTISILCSRLILKPGLEGLLRSL